MWPVRILTRYLAFEVLAYSVLAFLAAAPVILLPNVFGQIGDFFVEGLTAADLLGVLGWLLVLIAGYALPIGFVFGLLLALGRFYGDGEITAMRASGLDVFALVRPVLAVGVLLSLVSGTISIGLEHRAWKAIESTKRRLLSRGAVIEPGQFQRFGKRTLLTRKRLGTNRFDGIMIWDDTASEKPLLIFAESAEYAFEAETGILRLVLANGDIRMDRVPGERFEEHRISFASFDYAFVAPWLAGDHWRFRPNQLSFAELRAVASGDDRRQLGIRVKYPHPRHYEAHMHRLLAIPLTPLLFSLIGVPLAIFGFVRSRARGLLLALLLMGAYYGGFIFVYDAARNGLFPPPPAIWTPNAVALAIAAVLLAAAARSRR